MKLEFKKNEASEISVHLDVDDEQRNFSYVEMIKSLIDTRKMEDPNISGDFSEAERASIKSMVKHINDKIAPTDELSAEK